MMATDANVCPYPAGDSTLARMALEAAELGFDSIVTVGGEGSQSCEIEVLRGIVISAPSQKEIIRQVRKPAARNTTPRNRGPAADHRSDRASGAEVYRPCKRAYGKLLFK